MHITLIANYRPDAQTISRDWLGWCVRAPASHRGERGNVLQDVNNQKTFLSAYMSVSRDASFNIFALHNCVR